MQTEVLYFIVVTFYNCIFFSFENYADFSNFAFKFCFTEFTMIKNHRSTLFCRLIDGSYFTVISMDFGFQKFLYLEKSDRNNFHLSSPLSELRNFVLDTHNSDCLISIFIVGIIYSRFMHQISYSFSDQSSL